MIYCMNIQALTLLGSICNTIEYTISSTQIKLLPNDMDKKENQVNEIKDLPLNKQTKKNYHEFERRPVEG